MVVGRQDERRVCVFLTFRRRLMHTILNTLSIFEKNYTGIPYTKAEQTSDPNQKLLLAAKAGAARELYEETGMDVLRQLDRLQPAPLQHEEEARLPNLYKSRLFFFLPVIDDDFPQGNGVPPMGDLGKHLKLRLSVEHSGFTFQPEPAVAAEMLKLHSGGKCSEALLMAQQQGDGGGGETSSGMEGSSRDVLLPPPPKKDSVWCCFGSSPSQN